MERRALCPTYRHVKYIGIENACGLSATSFATDVVLLCMY